jgi:enediyne biosynthesis protein E4
VTTFRNEEKTLYRNLGAGMFQDMALRTGLSETLQPWISWGTRFLDYDNDGWLDIMVASGHVHDLTHKILAGQSYPQPLKLFHNGAGRRFTDVSIQAGPAFTTPIVGRALCTGDIDNDGGLDVVVTDAEGQPLILRNTVQRRGHWLSLRLEGPQTNRLGVGSRLTVETPAGKQIHNVTTTGSFLSANDARAHLGLGDQTRVANVTVDWWDGRRTTHGPFEVDREVVLRYGAGAEARPRG